MNARHARVLVVEESLAEALMIVTALTPSGGSSRFDIEIAEQASTARERLASEVFDAVIVDLPLPATQEPDQFMAICKAAGDVPIVALTRPEEKDAMDLMRKRLQPQKILALSLAHALQPRPSHQLFPTTATLSDRSLAKIRACRRQHADLEGADDSGRERAADALRRALQHGRLSLVYDPVVRLSDGSVTGFEALLRCPGPDLGRMTSDGLLDLAEKAGLIVPLTNWMIAESCWRLSAWFSLCPPGRPSYDMRIHLAAGSLANPRLAPRLRAILAANDLPPSCLIVEVEEASFKTAATHSTLVQLREIGVRVAAHSAGPTSLEALSRWPVDAIKLERPFTSGPESGASAETVCGIFGVAHRKGLQVVAGGVKTESQLTQLRIVGCDLAQGSLLASPCSPAAACDLVCGRPTRTF